MSVVAARIFFCTFVFILELFLLLAHTKFESLCFCFAKIVNNFCAQKLFAVDFEDYKTCSICKSFYTGKKCCPCPKDLYNCVFTCMGFYPKGCFWANMKNMKNLQGHTHLLNVFLLEKVIVCAWPV